jgi:hypothetical protein
MPPTWKLEYTTNPIRRTSVTSATHEVDFTPTL